MKVFINGIGAITPQGVFPGEEFLREMKIFPSGRLTVQHPRYKDFIPVSALRRMSPYLRMGLTAARLALQDAESIRPDAIVTATGLGAVENTDKFLDNLTDNRESMLNPTPFIHSTHNSVGSVIAIETKCKGYNMTYVHKNTAFEQGLQDAVTKVKDEKLNVLVGGIEEITETNYELKKHLNLWKINVDNSRLRENNSTEGTIPGEGSVFFYLSPHVGKKSYAEVEHIKTLYRLLASPGAVITAFLRESGILPAEIDFVLLGLNGDITEEQVYSSLQEEIFPDTAFGWYKHLCGEYETASSFAMLLAATILKNQKIPEEVMLNTAPSGEIKKILLYQHRFNRNHAFTLLSRC